jgi:hypothetical protein
MWTLAEEMPKAPLWLLFVILAVAGTVIYFIAVSYLGRRCPDCGRKLQPVSRHGPAELESHLRDFIDDYENEPPAWDDLYGCRKCRRIYDSGWLERIRACRNRHEFTPYAFLACKRCDSPAYIGEAPSAQGDVPPAPWDTGEKKAARKGLTGGLAEFMRKYPLLAEEYRQYGEVRILDTIAKPTALSYTDRLFYCRNCLTIMCWLDVPDTNVQYCVALRNDDDLRRAADA